MNLFNFLSTNVLGQLGDQIGTIWLGDIFYSRKFYLLDYYSIEFFKVQRSQYLNFLFSNLYNFIYLSLASFLGGILAYNLLTILFLVINSFSLYLVLSNLKISTKINIIFSFLFSAIPYFYLHFEHQTLLAIFPALLVIRNLINLKNNNIKITEILKISILIALEGLFSLYLLYFLLIYIFLFFLISFFYERNKIILEKLILVTFISVSLFSLLNINFINDFLRPNEASSKYDFPDKTLSQNVTSFSFDRQKPLNDFLYFSSRPWYFFLYPSFHPIFGSLTKEVIFYFSETRNFWIFKNYFPYEHNASFIGYSILLLTLFSFRTNLINNHLVKKLLLINLIIFILCMPPYFSVSGYNIYTPSYILYLIFPMFRSLSRFVIFMQINFFIIAALSLNELLTKYRIKTLIVFVFFIFWFTLDFSLNYKTTSVSINYEINKFLFENNKENSMIAVYPNSFRNEFLLNMPYYEKPLFNPSGLVRNEINFDSGKFTSNLDSCENLNYFYKFNGKYIVIKNYEDYIFININKLPTVFESKSERILIKSLDNIKEICK